MTGERQPPFEPGNTVALSHGARSPRMVEPIARELAAELVTVAPWTSRPAFAADIAAWANSEAQCRLLRAYIDEHGLLDGEGEPRSALGLLDKAESRAARLRQALGLSPMGLGRLLATLTAAARGTDEARTELDAVRAEGRRLVEARAPAELTPAPPDPDEETSR